MKKTERDRELTSSRSENKTSEDTRVMDGVTVRVPCRVINNLFTYLFDSLIYLLKRKNVLEEVRSVWPVLGSLSV